MRCVVSVASGTAFCLRFGKNRPHTPTFDARRCSEMKARRMTRWGTSVQRAKFAKATCSGKRAARKKHRRGAIKKFVLDKGRNGWKA